jgi:hypothetical protein
MQDMKSIERSVLWGGRAALVGLVCTLAVANAQAGDTKPFKETGQEYVVTPLTPGGDALPQPFFAAARALYGKEVWAGVIHQFSKCSMGGKGTSVAFEAVHLDPTKPKGSIIFIMKYETLANGDRFVVEGFFYQLMDETIVAEAWFVPELGTGKFEGATGQLTELRAIPGGYVMEGTITTVGASKK